MRSPWAWTGPGTLPVEAIPQPGSGAVGVQLGRSLPRGSWCSWPWPSGSRGSRAVQLGLPLRSPRATTSRPQHPARGSHMSISRSFISRVVGLAFVAGSCRLATDEGSVGVFTPGAAARIEITTTVANPAQRVLAQALYVPLVKLNRLPRRHSLRGEAPTRVR